MGRWKKLLLGVMLGGSMILGLGATYPSVFFERIFKDRVYWTGSSGYESKITDISSITLGANGAISSITNNGALTTGVGTKGSGYVVSDSVEYLSTGTGVGTLTTVAVNERETIYIEADVVGQAGTSTERCGVKIVGVYDRDGTADVNNIGSATTLVASHRTGMKGTPIYFTKETTNNTVHVNVKSSVAKKVQWVGNVRYVKVATTGGE